MNQTGRGALSMEDIEYVRSGFLFALERRPNKGVVVLIDESRLPRDPGNSLTRIIFYMKVLNSYENPIQGTYLNVVTSNTRPKISMDPEPYKTFLEALPVRVPPKHIVAQSYEEGKKELVDFNGFRVFRSEQLKSRRPVHHIAGDSMRSTLDLLEMEGLDRRDIPRCLGGDFDYKQVHRWIRQRLSVEDIMAAAPPTLQLDCQSSRNPEAKRKLNLANRALRKRVANQRNKATIESLQKERFDLSARNETLRKENSMMEAILAQSQMLILAQSQCLAPDTIGGSTANHLQGPINALPLCGRNNDVAQRQATSAWAQPSTDAAVVQPVQIHPLSRQFGTETMEGSQIVHPGNLKDDEESYDDFAPLPINLKPAFLSKNFQPLSSQKPD